jgi:hypothetical protein
VVLTTEGFDLERGFKDSDLGGEVFSGILTDVR